MHDTLSFAGLWQSPSVPPLLVRQIANLPADDRIDKVGPLFVAWSRLDDCQPLRQMVGGWASLPTLASRMPILQSALLAHIGRDYALAVPAALVAALGVVGSVDRQALSVFAARTPSRCLASVLLDLQAVVDGSAAWPPAGLHLDVWDVLLGRQQDYASELMSLRCWLLLDTLADLAG